MMVEHNQSTYNGGQYNNVYKFNGKELDDATGMYYYGARYYDPRISIFVSVDPLAEQTMTPYQYVHNNPIMFTDPTGMSAEGADGGGWLSKVWNSSKNEIKSWFGGRKSNYEVIVEEPQLIGWDYGESVPCIECHHNTTATNGEKIKGSGSIAFSGQGYESFGGWEDIRDKLIVSKSTDWSSYKYGKTPKFKDAFDGFSKGVSIGEDKNIQSLFKSKKANEEKPMDSLYPQETRWFGISVVVFPKIDSIPVNISPNSERGRAINTQNDYYRKYHNEYMKDSVIYEKSR